MVSFLLCPVMFEIFLFLRIGDVASLILALFSVSINYVFWYAAVSHEFTSSLQKLLVSRQFSAFAGAQSPIADFQSAQQCPESLGSMTSFPAHVMRQTLSSFEKSGHGILRLIAKQTLLVLITCVVQFLHVLHLLAVSFYPRAFKTCPDRIIIFYYIIVGFQLCAGCVCACFSFAVFNAQYRYVCNKCDRGLLKLVMFRVEHSIHRQANIEVGDVNSGDQMPYMRLDDDPQ